MLKGLKLFFYSVCVRETGCHRVIKFGKIYFRLRKMFFATYVLKTVKNSLVFGVESDVNQFHCFEHIF